MSTPEQDMTDMDNAGRLDLASRVFYYFRQQAGNTDPPAYEYLSDQDLMAALYYSCCFSVSDRAGAQRGA